MKTVVTAGATTTVTLTFPPEAFRRWDDDGHDWIVDPGPYDLLIAASASDVRAAIRLTL